MLSQHLIAFAVAIQFLGACSQELSGLDQAEIRKILEDRVDRYGKSVGIVVGTINSQGRQVVSYGKLDHGSGKRVDGDTLFEIGSITKVFTTILLADSVERGELSLDDPIAKFLPDSVRVPTKNGKEITLLHLATHTSGLPRMIDNMGPLDVNNPYANYSVEKVYDFLSTCEIAGEIGVSPEYSNLGIDLLGHILELHLGITYEELVRSRITRPLGMNDTVITRTPEQTERMARGHSWRLTPMQNWDFPDLPGSGALLSTVNDLLKFLAANLGLTMSPLTNAMRSTHEVRFDSDGEMAPVGLGWGISDFQGTEIVGHSGGTGGYRSLILFDLEQQTGVVVLSNSANDIDDIGAHLLVSEIDLAELEPSLQVIEIDPTIFDSYVGRYQLAENIFIDISREGERFYLKATDHSRFEIYPESETTYFAGVFRGKVMFARDERGVVDHLMLYEAGQETRAVRID